MERLQLEFKEDGFSKEDMDVLDSYFEYKRWFKKKSKAVFRDWEREKQQLRERTVKLIESEAEEQKVKLFREFEIAKMDSK